MDQNALVNEQTDNYVFSTTSLHSGLVLVLSFKKIIIQALFKKVPQTENPDLREDLVF